MFRRIDMLAALGALGLHAIIAWVLVSVPISKVHKSSRVEVEIVQTPKPPEPVLTPPKPPEPLPEPPKVIPTVKHVAAPIQSSAPKTPEPPPKTPDVPPPPTFNLDPNDTATANDVAVRAGTNNPGGDPNSKAPPGITRPTSGTGTAGAPNVYSPKSDIYIKTLPEIDGDACARMVSYPPEAEQLGIEGEVKLKVELDETGKVHDIKLLSGLGHGLDQAAIHALRHKCHFKPAIGTDGKPAAYVIQAYTWTFELPR